ncbi:MAG: AmpG family muropeptide MFS transporter [Magnetococcales bacterium]|nr:AmpG family muropeptide MFS transporter [Magnetococcales bacterium]MBF0113483.1 AmpG family muropeptide MFS transporter [Magnetococcales bacterium]
MPFAILPSRRTLQQWWQACSVYTEKRVLAILFLGFSSGLPLALTFSTLSVWLSEEGVSKTSIGLFALTGIPYTFKFLWSPLIDQLSLPWLCQKWGRRRSWALLTQVALLISLLLLGFSQPNDNPLTTAGLALLVAFWSASQDIVIDAYRVEILQERQYGAGAAIYVLGYRLGMLLSGAGALFLATYYGWTITYTVMALFMGVGILTIVLNPEPQTHQQRGTVLHTTPVPLWFTAWCQLPGRRGRLMHWIAKAVIAPFSDFTHREGWLIVLLFILFYKLGDSLAGVMSNPFYLELGFSKIEIATISKLFGLAATLLGSVVGGVMVSRLSIMKSLLYCGILQMLSNLMFVVLAQSGHNLTALTLTIAIENFSGGMGTSAFVAYLSSLCNIAYTATQYALLSSFMAFGRTLLASMGGSLADQMSWTLFFLLTTVAALPGLALLWLMTRRFVANPHSDQEQLDEPA